MTKFECYIFLESVEVTIHSSVVPTCRDDVFNASVDVVGGIEEVIEVVVKFG